MDKKRFIFFGAHPDDPDILFGGTAYKLANAGHSVKFVSVTNGDSGHFNMKREELAAARAVEAQRSAEVLGISEYEIFPLHDGELEPTVENRKRVIRCIREFKPDVVLTHRLCDYHPDHRATAQLVLDSAYMITVPLCCPEVPVPETIPVFAYSFDRFIHPRPQRADAAIEIDSVIDIKAAAMANHCTQFYEWLPWVEDGDKDFDVTKLNEEERKNHIMKWNQRFRIAADNGRETLKKVYGEEMGSGVVYAETFEQSDYSRQLPPEEFARLFLP